MQDNTSRIHPLALLQAYFILKRITEDKLDVHAAKVGAAAVQKIREKARILGISPDDISGIGMLFDVGTHTNALVGGKPLMQYNGRWAPPITTTLKEFDYLLR
jgi:hypothetical protein